MNNLELKKIANNVRKRQYTALRPVIRAVLYPRLTFLLIYILKK